MKYATEINNLRKYFTESHGYTLDRHGNCIRTVTLGDGVTKYRIKFNAISWRKELRVTHNSGFSWVKLKGGFYKDLKPYFKA